MSKTICPPKRIWVSVCGCERFHEKLDGHFKSRRECDEDTEAVLHQQGGRCGLCGTKPVSVKYVVEIES